MGRQRSRRRSTSVRSPTCSFSHGFLREWDDTDRSKIQAAFQEWGSYRYE